MKKRLATCLVLVVLLALAAVAFACIRPPAGHCDFDLRMNEISCVIKGMNPFHVWNGDVEFPPYASNIPKKPVPAGCTKLVNAYAPWEYVYMMPFAFLRRPVAWFAFSALMGMATLALAFLSRPTDKRDISHEDRLLVIAFPLVVVSYLLWSNASVGNFIAVVLPASVLMAWALAEDKWFLAGILWALAMVKPQSSILFAVPLLVRGRFMTCVVAGLTCLAASALPALMCNASIFDMLVQGPAANAELFEGCGTWPKFLCGRLGGGADIGIGLAIGAVLCAWMTWLLRREEDWLVYLMPAAVCASCWTYTQAYSHAMGWFLAYAIVSTLLRNPSSRFLWALLALSVPVLSRVFLAWHGFAVFFGLRFPMSEYAFRVADSLNSTLSLALAAALCIWLSRRRSVQHGAQAASASS